ncbi:hypothetical protein [Haloferula sp.]|uniref:hypothetical protein n=1 Tax=Haloferula sp. TaxID=2497595 RepID=UPI00329DF43A
MTKNLTSLFTAIAVIQTGFAGEPDAFQEPLAPVQETDSGWNYKVSLYAPILGLDGTSRIGPTTVPIDLGFSDIAENLEAGFIIAGEAQKGKFSVIGDLIWLKLAGSTYPTANTYAGLKVEQTVANLAFGYQLFESDCWTLDALAGAAYTGMKIDQDITVFPPGPVPPTSNVFGADESWVDPFVGFRFRYRPSDNWRIFGRVDYGGWGIASDLYLQAILGGGYKVNDSFGIYAAYRFISVDYSKTAFAYDVETSGPQIGLVFTF